MVVIALPLLLLFGAMTWAASLWTITLFNGTSNVDIIHDVPAVRVYPVNGTLTVLVDPYSDLAIKGFRMVDHAGNEVEGSVLGLPTPKEVTVYAEAPAYLVVSLDKWRSFVPSRGAVPYSEMVEVANRTEVTVKYMAIVTMYSYVEPRIVGDYTYILDRRRIELGNDGGISLYVVEAVAYSNFTLIGIGKANVTYFLPVGGRAAGEWGETRVRICGKSVLVRGTERPVTAVVHGTPITIYSLPPNVTEFDVPSVEVEGSVVLDVDGNPIVGNVSLELQGDGARGRCLVAGRGPYKVHVLINGTLADVGVGSVASDGKLVVRTRLVRLRAELGFEWPNVTLLYPSYAKLGEPVEVTVVYMGDAVATVRTTASRTTIIVSKRDAMERVCFTDLLGAPLAGATLYADGVVLKTDRGGCTWVLRGIQRGVVAYGGLELSVDLKGQSALPLFTEWSILAVAGLSSGIGAAAAGLVAALRKR